MAMNLFRTALQSSTRPITYHGRRSLASTVLLSKSYEDRTLNELKKEAKSRGLAQYGNKATLIARIQSEDQRRQQIEAHASSSLNVNGSQMVRDISTSAAVQAQPETSPTKPSSGYTMDVKIPDLSQLPPSQSADVPFVPDFWKSAKVKAEIESKGKEQAISTETLPKIMTAAAPSTHPAGGPSHKIYDSSADQISEESRPSYSKPLSPEEKQGLWVLLGVVTGAWLLGGLGSPSNTESKPSTKNH